MYVQSINSHALACMCTCVSLSGKRKEIHVRLRVCVGKCIHAREKEREEKEREQERGVVNRCSKEVYRVFGKVSVAFQNEYRCVFDLRSRHKVCSFFF